MRPFLLALFVLPITLSAQQGAGRARRDTLTTAERAQVREAARDAQAIARTKLAAADSAARRQRAEAAAASAFGSPDARMILERARLARVSQDSALNAYRATTTQRLSVGMGVRRIGTEKLLFRMDNVAQISWKRGVGVRIAPQGSRMTIPMASAVHSDAVSAVSVPYFPGRESLWFPSSNFGVVKTDIDEREMIHPLARGAETYYRYETGDSVNITLPDARVIRLRELRITARRPEWRLFVGSFWFDRDGGQLVRAAYRLAVDIDIWDVASQSVKDDVAENVATAQTRDSLARERLPRDLYVKDSIARAARQRERERQGRKPGEDDDVPMLVKATMRPARAKLDAITVEYGLYEGRFWLPRANSATASVQMGFVRIPVRIDEKFSYDQVNGDFALAAIPTSAAALRGGDTSATSSADSVMRAQAAERSGNVAIDIGSGSSNDTSAVQRARRDSAYNRNSGGVKARQCATDSTWTRLETRYSGALRIAYDLPCDMDRLQSSPTLPPRYASEDELFDETSRDELIGALDLSLQPGFAPQRIKLRTGTDLLRYNRVEGLSVGAVAAQELGAGYALAASGRIGHADLHANGELSVARSNGTRTVTGAVFHRLNATNPEWAGALTLSASLPALLYARDEGFYYRTLGAELRETREFRGGSIDYRAFIERQWSAGDSDVVNTFNVFGAFDDRRFRRNIAAERVSVTGIGGTYLRAFGNDPLGLRFVTATRAEAGTGTFEYARLALDVTATRTVGRFATALTGAAGSSAGRVPAQRLWYVGGLRTVRGQIIGTQAGDAFWLGRAEIGTKFAWLRPVGFFDIGWAGSRTAIGKTQPQRGAGFGVGLLDGLLRVDIARGLYPTRGWRSDFYIGAPL